MYWILEGQQGLLDSIDYCRPFFWKINNFLIQKFWLHIFLKKAQKFKEHWLYQERHIIRNNKTCIVGGLLRNFDFRLISTYDKFFTYVAKTHCSYLYIYISQNIRLCKGDFEGQFQTTLQAKGINFLIWKFRFIILIFLLFFAGVCQIAIQVFQLFRIGLTVWEKHWIWQILQKIEEKEN